MSDARSLLPDDVIRVKVKAELRKRLRGMRKTMPLEACEARSRAIVARLEAHPAFVDVTSVALFWPIVTRHEVDLRSLDDSLRARGARVAYPTIDADTNLMTFRFAAREDLVERGFGFEEPTAEAEEAAALDVIVVPALAIDPTGHRIGYGAGYYDRTLPRYPGAKTIGVAYDFQLVAEVPYLPDDVRVQDVVTDARTIAAQP